MGTKVIDKLRIQGSAAPRAFHESRKHDSRNSFHDPTDTCHVILQHSGKEGASSIASRSNPSSAASRRLEFLHRVQQANRGLTSADLYSSHSHSLPTIQFLLRGKPVHGDTEPASYDVSAHQRVGHYKTSAKEVYRARHKVSSEQGFYPEARDYGGFYRAVRSADCDAVSTVPSHAGSSLASTSFFYLGPPPPASAPTKSSQLLQRPKVPPPSAASEHHEMRVKRAAHKAEDSFALAGQQLQTPRVVDYEEYDYLGTGEYPLSRSGGYHMPDIHPHTTFPINRRRHYWPRSNTKDITKTELDPTLLRQCLKVQQSHQITPDSNKSPRDMVKLKHYTQYIKKDDHKVNYNNPYRNFRTKERKALTEGGKYLFKSVDSYIHFNKIYPKMDSKTPPLSEDGSTKVPKIPKVDGFSPHCTDTVLLKMMFEMNRPRSIKSSSKYSDVAVHKDLDEFLVVGTPSGSRSTSVMSKKVTERRTKSLISSGVDIQEEDENECEKGKSKDEHIQRVNSKEETLKELSHLDNSQSTTLGEEPADETKNLLEKDNGNNEDNSERKESNDEVENLTTLKDDDIIDESDVTQSKTKEVKNSGDLGKETGDDREEKCYSSSSGSTEYGDNVNGVPSVVEDVVSEAPTNKASDLGV